MTLDFRVEFSEDSPLLPVAQQQWVDITEFALTTSANGGRPIQLTRGRSDETGGGQTGTCTLTLDNTQGYFSPDSISTPWQPNWDLGKYLRVTALVGSSQFYRFTGLIDDITIDDWGQAGTHKTVQVQASDRLKRLSVARKFRSMLEMETLLADPDGYWPLGEDSGASRASSITPTAEAQLVVQNSGPGTVDFGSGTGPGTDGLAAPMWTPTLDDAGALTGYAWLTGTLTGSYPYGTGATLVLACWFRVSTILGGTGSVVAELTGAGFQMQLKISSAGNLSGFVSDVPVVSSATVDGPTVNTNTTYLAVLVATQGQALTLYVSGTTYTGGTCPTMTKTGTALNLGKPFAGTISHAALYNTTVSAAQALAQYSAGATGTNGMTTDQALRSIAGYAGIDQAEIEVTSDITGTWWVLGVSQLNVDTILAPEAFGRSKVQNIPFSGRRPSELMRQVEEIEQGTLFVRGDGRIVFSTRAARWNVGSPVYTFQPSEIDGSLTMRKSEQQPIVTDSTVSRTGGGSYRVVDEAAAALRGYSDEQLDFAFYSDSEAADRAAYRVAAYKNPKTRCPSIPVNVRTHATPENLLGRDIGDLVAIGGLTSDAPDIGDEWIEGITESISINDWTMEFLTSPVLLGTFWALDDTTYSVLGTSTILAF